jgi:Rrf2 family protein
MRLTTRTSYGVQALYDMAFHGAGRTVQAREVSERQGIPLRYLEQILQDLRRAGLVDAKRGPGGGYALARPPAEVRVDEVVEALDGPIESLLSFGEDERERERRPRRRARPAPDGVAVVSGMWREVAAGVAGLLAGVTLQDLVARAEALGVARTPAGPQMYFI